MNLSDFMSNAARDVEEVLMKRIRLRDNEEYLLKIVKGGKRLRPALSILSFKVCGGNKEDYSNAVLGAASIELAHCASLCYDDIIDKDITRRENPSLWADEGVSNALLTSNEAMLLAFKIAKELGEKITSVFLESLDRTLNGAMYELELENQDCLSPQEYYKMITLKSASFFGAGCKIGSIIASASSDLIKIMGNYGSAIGTSYQLADDLVDWKNRKGKRPSRSFMEEKMEENIAKAEKLANNVKVPETGYASPLKEAPRSIIGKKICSEKWKNSY